MKSRHLDSQTEHGYIHYFYRRLLILEAECQYCCARTGNKLNRIDSHPEMPTKSIRILTVQLGMKPGFILSYLLSTESGNLLTVFPSCPLFSDISSSPVLIIHHSVPAFLPHLVAYICYFSCLSGYQDITLYLFLNMCMVFNILKILKVKKHTQWNEFSLSF